MYLHKSKIPFMITELLRCHKSRNVVRYRGIYCQSFTCSFVYESGVFCSVRNMYNNVSNYVLCAVIMSEYLTNKLLFLQERD